jgi:hypothetical protein
VDTILAKMLRDSKLEAVPLGAGTDDEVESRAANARVDYLLKAEVSDLKQGGGKGLGGALSRASSLAGGAPSKEVYTATVNYKLDPRGGGPAKLAATASGSTSQFGLKEAMALGRVATMFTPMGMMRPGGSGMFPFMSSLMGSGIIGGGGMGMMGSIDPNVTVMQTTMMAGIPPAGPFGGESQEAAVSAALDKVAKAVAGSLKTTAAAPAGKKNTKKK